MRRPPQARVEIIHDTFFGTTVEDPYRWMEDQESDESTAWIQGQHGFTRALLDGLPERENLLGRIHDLNTTGTKIYHLDLRGDRLFHMSQAPDSQLPSLMVRQGESVRVLVKPEGSMIDWYSPSHDGTMVAYGVSTPGSEASELRLVRTDDGHDLECTFPQVYWGMVCWLPDDSGFIFPQFPTAGGQDRFQRPALTLHRLGEPTSAARVLLQEGLRSDVPLSPHNSLSLHMQPHCPWGILHIGHGVARELTAYRVAVNDLERDPGEIPWIQVCDRNDDVTQILAHGEDLYLKTLKDAPRGRILTVPAQNPELRHATEVLPERDTVLLGLFIAQEKLHALSQWDGISSLERIEGGGGVALPLPYEGTLIDMASDTQGSQLFLKMSGWVQSPAIYQMDLETLKVDDTGWVPPHPADFSDYEATRVEATSPDGTQVPLSIICRRGLPRDGQRPTLLHVYGAYGISRTPGFNPMLLPWLERGGVFAVGHVRGGGERGKTWHTSGHLTRKQNCIDDVIACGDHLVGEGFTSAGRIAVEGGSAGGISAGGAVVTRPDFWGAALFLVPTLNLLRKEHTPVGPANVPEFGTVTTEEGFQALQVGDICSRVMPGTDYPAIMVTVGMRDPRVLPWEGMKGVATFQAATASDRPVLLRVNFEGGHGVAETRETVEMLQADKLAFLWHYLNPA